jgi:hypothetical protein
MKQKTLDIIVTHFPSTYAYKHDMDLCTEEIVQMMCDMSAKCLFDLKASSMGRIITILRDQEFTDEQIENALNKLK